MFKKKIYKKIYLTKIHFLLLCCHGIPIHTTMTATSTSKISNYPCPTKHFVNYSLVATSRSL